MGVALFYLLYLGLSSPEATKIPSPVVAAAPPPVAKTAPAPMAKAAPPPVVKATPAPETKAAEAPVVKATPAPAAEAAPAPVVKTAPVPPVKTALATSPRISKSDVQLLLNRVALNELLDKEIELPFNDQRLNVVTSLDPTLQHHLINAMDRKNSRFIGVVVMEGDTGRLLAMAGFDKTDPQANPCLNKAFPAASLFKIVTAAAAVDQCNYTGNTSLRFNGYKHTLYKSQLKEANNRYTHTISFADAFAQSVNPIFGKIGTLYLGKAVLEEYARGFGFNQPLDFELPVAPSRMSVKDSPYNWAEVASGFNNDTVISPVHAAEMVSAVLNQGLMVPPTLVDRIMDANGRVIYHAHATWQQRAMTAKASKVLAGMMERTVTAGTARRQFRTRRPDPVLSSLRIGGKTGSIFNRSHDARFDWFVGFAEEKHGRGRIVVAALVAHEEYIGIRAGTYARMAMTHYFQNQLAHQEAPQTGKSDG